MPQVTVDGATLYYERHGDAAKPAVVLAHGRGGNAASWWQQVPALMRDWQVVTFDHRGFARSAAEPDAGRFADDLAAILDHAGIAKAALVCQSMGGRTGLGFALKYRHRVRALVLCGTTGGLYDETIGGHLAAFRPRPARIGGFSTLALAPDFPERAPALAFLFSQIQAFNTRFDYSKPASFAAVEFRIDPAVLKGWSLPTLVLGGTADQIVPEPVLHHLAALIPGAELQLMPGVGHSTYFEAASEFNAVVSRFLVRQVN